MHFQKSIPTEDAVRTSRFLQGRVDNLLAMSASSLDFRNKLLDIQLIDLKHQRKKRHRKSKKLNDPSNTLSASFYSKYVPFMLFALGMSQDEMLLTYHQFCKNYFKSGC